MTPADIAASRAILAAATQGTWITVQPRSQEGTEALASFGPAFADDFPAATQIRLAGSGDFGDIAARQARMPWEQHAANCKAAAHAVNTLPVALDALEETRRVLAALVESLPTCWIHVLRTGRVYAQCDEIATYTANDGVQDAPVCSGHEGACVRVLRFTHADALLAAVRFLRGTP